MVKAKGDITITNNLIENVTKNGLNLYSSCLANENAKLTITGNEISNWDSDKDAEDVGIGGRAIRIDFAGAHNSAAAEITGNKLIPPTYEEGQTSVDEEYVKLTSVGIEVDLTKNYWGSEKPDFTTILSVGGDKATECAYMPYYTDREMENLNEVIPDEGMFILSYPSKATLTDGHPEPDGCEAATFVGGGEVSLEAGNWYYTAVTAQKNVEGAIANLQFQINGVPNDAFNIHMYDFEGKKWYSNPPVWGSGFTAEDNPYNKGVTTYIFIEAKEEGSSNISIVLKDIVDEKTLSNTLVGAVSVTKAMSEEE
jgi:hypothetical protein